MEVQSDITFATKLQFGPLFLQNTLHDQYLSNESLPCMGESHMLIISHLCILEGNFTIQIWLKLQAKYHSNVDYWMILNDFKVQHGTVHV